MYNMPQDHEKALELFHQAKTWPCYILLLLEMLTTQVRLWQGGKGDEKKAEFELAALGGHAQGRHSLAYSGWTWVIIVGH